MNIQPPLEHEEELSEEGKAFHKMLDWLDPDREEASRKFLEIERRLEKLFICRGCPCPEELKDETVRRVIGIIMNPKKDLLGSWVGDPIAQFYGVAHFVYLEYFRKAKKQSNPLPVPSATPRSEEEYACLEECMSHLSSGDRQLILEYHEQDKHYKIKHRKQMARQMGLQMNALRIQACRIRGKLRDCIVRCLDKSQNSGKCFSE